MATTERMMIWIGPVLLALLCPVQGSICKGVMEPILTTMFSTKTAYRAVQKDTSHWDQFQREVSDCEAKQIWLLVRHGTRYPTKNDMGDLVAILPRLGRLIAKNFIYGRGCLNEEIVRKMEDWIIPYEIWDREQLHEVGSDELFEMGEYWRNMYPHLLKGPYDSAHFKVDFTVKNRTGQSAYHFLRGVFGDDEIGTIELPKPYEPNFILRFYKACPRWLKEVYRNNKTTYKERNLFKQTQVFQGVLHAVSARLGFLYVLSSAEVLAMYDECRYESAWWPHVSSPWCAPFTKHELEVIEYYQDLKYYYEDSYGHPLNTETACRTIGDLYTHLRTTVYEGQSPRGVFYFTHDKAIMKVLAKLGLFRPDQHPRHDNYDQLRDRVWRTSFVSPFAANIAFVLYKCGNSHRVATFFHGHPIPLLKSCAGISCSWEDIKPFLAEIDQECDLSKLCGHNKLGAV